MPRTRWAWGAMVAMAAMMPSVSGCDTEVACTSSSATGSGVAVYYGPVVAGHLDDHLVARLCIDSVCATRRITRTSHPEAFDVPSVFDLTPASLHVGLMITDRTGDRLFDGRTTAVAQPAGACQPQPVLGLTATTDGRLSVTHLGPS